MNVQQGEFRTREGQRAAVEELRYDQYGAEVWRGRILGRRGDVDWYADGRERWGESRFDLVEIANVPSPPPLPANVIPFPRR